MTIQSLTLFDLVTERAGSGGLFDTLVRAGESNADEGTTDFICSTDDEDRAGDVVRQQWSLGDFRANPVILDNHLALRVVGRGEGFKVAAKGEHAGKLVGTVRWALDAPDPLIRTVGWQHLNGYRNAGSVGFRAGKRTQRNKLPKDHPKFSQGREVETPWGTKVTVVGRYFERNTLLEFSSATIPMNASALHRSYLDALNEIDPDDLVGRAEVVGQTVPQAVGADLVELTRRLGDDALRELGSLLLPGVLQAMRADPATTRRTLRVLDGMAPAELPTTPSPPAQAEAVDPLTRALARFCPKEA